MRHLARTARCAVLLLAACAHDAAAPRPSPPPPPAPAPLPPLGTPAEVHTPAGPYDGYEVDDSCRDPGTRGVRGLGARQLPAITGDGHAFNAWADALGSEAEHALAPIVVGVGFGIGCHDHDRAFTVYVRTYREIDPAIEQLGRFIRDRDLGVRFLVLPAPRIEPL